MHKISACKAAIIIMQQGLIDSVSSCFKEAFSASEWSSVGSDMVTAFSKAASSAASSPAGDTDIGDVG